MTPLHLQRFEAKYVVDPNSGCWLWTGSAGSAGYGQLRVDGRTARAHRLSYEHFVAPIPDGMFVCHKCDVPACVNPEHLFLGTNQDNVDDAAAKGRTSGPHFRACGERSSGAKLTDEQAREIRRLLIAGVSRSEIARRHGLHHTTVSELARGKTWRTHGAAPVAGGAQHGERHHQAKLTAEDVVLIRRRRAAGESAAVLATDFGVSSSTVRRIVRGDLWQIAAEHAHGAPQSAEGET